MRWHRKFWESYEGLAIGQLVIKLPPGIFRKMAGVVCRETKLGLKSLRKKSLQLRIRK